MTTGYPDWLRAFLLLGKHDSSFLPVLLGPDGSLYCVLQGEYEGALRTVHLDDEGRISAFVVDELDAWGQMLQVGNAEHAARLGSIVRLDRRGTVLFQDSFEDGHARWKISTGGTGTAHTITPERAFSGGYSLRLTSPSGAGEFIQTYTQLPTCLATSFGVSAMLCAPDEFTDVYLKLDVYTGTTLDRIHARLHYATLKVQVYNSSSAWQDVCSFLADEGSTAAFHMLKVCGDISTGKYVRLLYDYNEYDLSAIAMSAVGADVISKLIGIVLVYGLVGANSVIEVDDAIITANET